MFATNPTGDIVYNSNVGVLPGYESKYSVDGEGFDMTIHDLQVQDGGKYACASAADFINKDADVIVLGERHQLL